MFVDSAREHLADIMTVSRGLATIPSASAILDTSNYTFQAISYGKDSQGFKYHAHTILSPSADGIIKVVSYDSDLVSSYSPRLAAVALSNNYKQYPSSPTPTDTRLEMKTTLPNYTSGVPDLGQYINPSIDPSLSAYTHLIGGFPAASGTRYQIFKSSGGLLFSGTIASGTYNLSGIMDASGFLTFAQGPTVIQVFLYDTHEASPTLYDNLGYGALRVPGAEFPKDVSTKWLLPPGEIATLNLFGGIYHLGLWCLDIKEMLKNGYNPPYSFNPLNNIRKYKLFAKKTFNEDLISYSDFGGISGFVELFQSVTGWDNSLGMVIKWNIKFV